ncbi:hypothetical protein J1N35_021844 [Gossypium stocksii]|uniref:Uncharacterized protein n=1 Tax=Gossypium stocksii TaxID=47602 RepID=A0A9D3VFL7_9ROSI|nr:hypothetical protein J1N35_021844 [Gossypium stocksii]
MEMVDGILSITFFHRVHKFIERKMLKTLIVKLLSRRIGFHALLNKTNILWKLMNPIQLMDLENDFNLVHFNNEEDYNQVQVGGSCVVYGCAHMNSSSSGVGNSSAFVVDEKSELQKRVDKEDFGPWMLVECWQKERPEQQGDNERRSISDSRSITLCYFGEKSGD